MILSRLWQGQDKRTAARQTLAELYGWFTEGFDTPDLQEDKALLDELVWWSARNARQRPDQTHTSAGRAGNRSSRAALRLGLARRRLAADHRHEPVVALNADQLLKRARNAIDRRSLSRCTPLIAHPDTSGAPCRSSRAARCRGLR